MSLTRLSARRWRAAGLPAQLDAVDRGAAVAVEGAFEADLCGRWAARVLGAKKDWVADFGREQFALGRAFYTHYETGRAALYFRDAAASDARVERHLPGMQSAVLELFEQLTGGRARRRHGFCGPGVHVFPASEKVSRSGGVVHFDIEGLTPHQIQTKARALSLVVMLQPPRWGGGLRLWSATYRGREEPTHADLATPAFTYRYRPGSALLMSSYRLHQIRPFRGDAPRISITVHAAEIDRGVWETWF
jgi:hypothetical protein